MVRGNKLLDMPKKIEIKGGTKINNLTILRELPPRIRTNGKPRRVLLCKCDCGQEKEILFQSVSIGRVFSCGCFQSKVVKEGKFAISHGLSSHPLFTVWRCMISRCYDSSHYGYKYYGAKGVEVCSEWRESPKVFIEWALSNGWKKGLQLDKDIKGNSKLYSPDMCIFVTPYINLMNRSNTVNKLGWNQNIEY